MGRAKHEKRKAEKAKKKLQKNDVIKKDLKWLWLALILSFVSYGALYDNETTNYDDDIYVTDNSLIQTMDLGTLYSEFYWNQYSPLAMTIMGLEYKLFEDSEVPLRVISVLIHLACVLLVFLIIRQLFKDDLVAGLTALLFGVHPMQVESVAWLTASMKIGTYALFFLWSIYAYIQYLSDESKKGHLLLSLVLFLASCLCKEQAVILPIVLLLIDYLKGTNPISKKAIVSKVPFFLISLVFGIVTLKAAQGAVPVEKVYDFILAERVLFAFYSTGAYLLKLLVPVDLSMFYTYPMKGAIPAYFYAFPILILGVLYLLFNAFKAKKKWLVFGITFFFINVALTAMTSVLSVRDVIMADRYVYLPAIGFFFLLVYWTVELSKKNSILRYVSLAFALIYTVISYQRVDIWQNSITLFTDVIEKGSYKDRVNPYLALAYNNRGISYKRQGKLNLAMSDYENAIKANLSYPNGYLNRGNIHFDAGRDDDALEDYNKVLQLKPDNMKALSARGAIYAKRKEYDMALTDLNEAIRLDKFFVDAYSNRALTYLDMGKMQEAIDDCTSIINMTPGKDDMYEFRGYLYSQKQDFQLAISDFDRAIQLNPGRASYFYKRATAYLGLGNKSAALQDANKAKVMGYKVPQQFFDSLR